MKPLKVVFCATPDFAVPTLKLLADHPQVELLKVISMPNRPKGRGRIMSPPPVAEYAKAHKLPLFQTDNINREEQLLKSLEGADLIIVLAFAQFLGQKILNLPKIGPFNIHTSLLPKYRGAAPIQYAILNGEKFTGVSIQRMVKKMDAGDLVYSHKVPIGLDETSGELFERLKKEVVTATERFLKLVLENKLTYTAQDSTEITYAPTLKKEDGHLSFANHTTEEIINRVRAFSPWPGTYCYIGKKRLKVLSVRPYDLKLTPGQTSTAHNFLVVGCRDASIRIHKLQLEGRKSCSDVDFLNGLKSGSMSIELS
jgi:methionyl-tRNA formyltransferase